jgi:hypothetical protein
MLDTDEYNCALHAKLWESRKHILVKRSALDPTIKSYLSLPVRGNDHGLLNFFSGNSCAQQPCIISNNCNGSNFHKLPKLDLLTFEGNILDWQSFWDSFDSAIHSNNALAEVQKFNCLKHCYMKRH